MITWFKRNDGQLFAAEAGSVQFQMMTKSGEFEEVIETIKTSDGEEIALTGKSELWKDETDSQLSDLQRNVAAQARERENERLDEGYKLAMEQRAESLTAQTQISDNITALSEIVVKSENENGTDSDKSDLERTGAAVEAEQSGSGKRSTARKPNKAKDPK